MNDPAAVLQKILADPEFQTDWREDLGKHLVDAVKHLLDRISQLSGLERSAVLLVCLAFLAGILWSVLASYRQAAAPERSAGAADARAPAEPAEASLLAARARDFAASGRYREAARTLQQAVYRALADQADVAWDGARADWEWVARFGSVAGLVAFTEEAQRVAYAAWPEGAESARFDTLWSDARSWVGP